MTSLEIIEKIKSLENVSAKKIYLNHGAKEPYYGVKIEDLKKIQKKVKKNYELSLELFDSGISDAMYLAGLIADETKMTKDDLNRWAEKAYWYMLSEFTVAWVAAESAYALEIALEWIESDKENIASSGWATLSNIATLKPDNEIDIDLMKKLMERVVANIHQSPNRIRYVMNVFIISVACYIPELTQIAIQNAEKIGKVQVNMDNTACRVPYAPEYIKKVLERAPKKKKSVRC